MNNQQKPAGMPSILGDVAAPFSGPRAITGVSPEFDTVYQNWQKNQTPETNTHILSTIQPVIDTALQSYGGTAQSPTLKSRARIMALKALGSYDPARGNVRNHLLSQMQSLRRLSAKEQNIISLPEQVGLDFQHMVNAESELRDQLSREPSTQEIADHTGISTRRLQKIKSFHQPLAEGSLTHEGDDSGDSPGEVASHIPGAHRADDAWLSFVYDDLGPTDKLIMDMTLGRNGKRKSATQDIARKLNVSSGAVSQRAAKIQQMLDKRHTYDGF